MNMRFILSHRGGSGITVKHIIAVSSHQLQFPASAWSGRSIHQFASVNRNLCFAKSKHPNQNHGAHHMTEEERIFSKICAKSHPLEIHRLADNRTEDFEGCVPKFIDLNFN
jgi:hypothetical protein